MSPIVISQSRLKLAVLFVLFAALSVVLAFLTFTRGFIPHVGAYPGVSRCAPGGIAPAIAAGAGGMSLWQPGTLTADDRGVVYRNWRHERRIAWNDVAEFVVFAPGSRLRSPGLQLKDNVAGRKFVSFGRNWEKTPEEIVEGLRQARPQSGADETGA